MPQVAGADRQDLPQARPRDVESITARALRRCFREDLSVRFRGLHRIVVELDRSVRVVKIQPVVMGEVHKMQQRFLAGFYPENRMPGGVAGSRLDGHKPVRTGTWVTN